jgi:hypothetical protein
MALVERACAVLGTVVETDALGLAVGRWERGVARLLEDNEELSDYAARLESDAREAGERGRDGSLGPFQPSTGADRDEDEDEDGMGDLTGLAGPGDPEHLAGQRIPSRDELAAEVERFLRDRTHGEPGEDG